jgi:hypothetical protein
MNIANLILKKFSTTPVKVSIFNQGDIRYADVKLSFSYKKKKYKIIVRNRQAVCIPINESFEFSDIEEESTIWLCDTATSGIMVLGFKDIFPEITEDVDDELQNKMFKVLRTYTNFTKEDLNKCYENRQRAIEVFRKDFGLE